MNPTLEIGRRSLRAEREHRGEKDTARRADRDGADRTRDRRESSAAHGSQRRIGDHAEQQLGEKAGPVCDKRRSSARPTRPRQQLDLPKRQAQQHRVEQGRPLAEPAERLAACSSWPLETDSRGRLEKERQTTLGRSAPEARAAGTGRKRQTSGTPPPAGDRRSQPQRASPGPPRVLLPIVPSRVIAPRPIPAVTRGRWTDRRTWKARCTEPAARRGPGRPRARRARVRPARTVPIGRGDEST